MNSQKQSMISKIKSKLKPEKSTFWKDPIESTLVHLGKKLDSMSVDDLVNVILYGSLAYLSLKTLAVHKKEKVKTYETRMETLYTPATGEPYQVPRTVEVEKEVDIVTYNPVSALVGPIGLKLATTMGGTPPVSQAAGLTILTSLGIAQLPQFKTPEEAIEAGVPPLLARLGYACDQFLKSIGL